MGSNETKVRRRRDTSKIASEFIGGVFVVTRTVGQLLGNSTRGVEKPSRCGKREKEEGLKVGLVVPSVAERESEGGQPFGTVFLFAIRRVRAFIYVSVKHNLGAGIYEDSRDLKFRPVLRARSRILTPTKTHE